MNRLFTAACISLIAMVLGAGVRPAFAQAVLAVIPSQITPPSLRPEPPIVRGGVSIPQSAGAEAPAGSEKFFIVPGGLIVEGEFTELVEIRERLAGEYAGKKVSVAEIFALAARMEQAYVRAGYVLVRVSVPPQKIVDGDPVRLFVIDGYVEAINTDALPSAVRDVVRGRTEGLVGVRRLTLARLERQLLIAGDVAGLRLRSTLSAGKAPGAVNLVLDGSHQLISGTASVDNRLSSSLSRLQFGTSIAINSALGQGEQIYGSLISNQNFDRTFSDDPRMRVFGVGVVMPLGHDGLTATPEFTDSRTHGRAQTGAVDSPGHLQRWSMRVAYPLIRSRTETLSVSGSIEHLSQVNAAPQIHTEINRDEYTSMRGSIDWAGATWWGAPLLISVSGAQGLGGRDGAHLAVPLSRQGSGPTFSKAGFNLQYSQGLPMDGLHADFMLSGQTSFNAAVFRSEQFSLDGTNLISGLPPGALSVDRGLAARGELVKAYSFAIGGVSRTASPYLFAAAGAGSAERPTSVERAHISGVSFGAGVRGDFALDNARKGLSLGLELARQHSDAPGVARSTRLSFLAASRF